jgi:GNAT superfamily N-acetyltransferase
MAGGGSRDRAVVEYRPAMDDDLFACTQIWSVGIEDYLRRLNQPWFAGDAEPLRRLLAHFLATDPERFVVATTRDVVVGFGSATQRDDTWFLGMLFVLPEFQARHVGRELLERVLPPPGPRSIATLATATDSLQPVSNALYSRYGMVPRLPVFNLVGRPSGPRAFPALPPGVHVRETDWSADHDATEREAADTDRLDAVVLGYAHPADHAFLRAEGRRRFVGRDESGHMIGYGYIAPSGRFGPVASSDAALLAPIVGHLVTAVHAPGAYASWIPGDADGLFVALLDAGFRFESFPALMLWNRSFADFSRYVPINLALL